MQNEIQTLLPQFGLEPASSIHTISTGHINQTFYVETSEQRVIVQRINTQIFPSVPLLMRNIQIYLKNRQPNLIACPVYYQSIHHEWFIEDQSHHAWRAYPWIEGRSLKKITTSSEAEACGLAYGQFLASAWKVPVETIKPVIPGFFDLQNRINALDQAVQNAVAPGRLKRIQPLLDHLYHLRETMLHRYAFSERHALPLRCIHADTKPSNVLFHPTETKAIGVIDLDTIASHYLYYDFSDGARATANQADEAGQGAHINLDFLLEFSRGFLKPLHHLLSPLEKESLIETLPLVSFMLTIRFATDYCENDRYFRVEDPEHNYRRAHAQYQITQDLSSADARDCVRMAIESIESSCQDLSSVDFIQTTTLQSPRAC